MKIVQINAVCGVGSTGKICVDISRLLSKNNIENYILYSVGNSDYPLGIKYSNANSVKAAALESRVFGNWGFENKSDTKRLISQLERINPDIVHLHNIHSHSCNLETLFNWLKRKNKKVVWTFHDCWAFTGYCMYYDIAGCDRWKNQCFDCPQKNRYSWIFDRSRSLQHKKKQLYADMDLTVVTPSDWLAGEVEKSFLRNCTVKVINNGIDLAIFKPTESDFREKYNCQDKYILLGVSFEWEKRKGLDVFIELSRSLSDEYQIVLAGTNAETDKLLPDNIISIHRTQNQRELVQIYSAADVLVNPTREENYPTVNMESLACSTPVVTFNTGGSAEIIDKTCGSSIKKDDIGSLKAEIIRICRDKPYSSQACLNRAQFFDKNIKFREYVDLYREIFKEL